jgi:hypothetical protein
MQQKWLSVTDDLDARKIPQAESSHPAGDGNFHNRYQIGVWIRVVHLKASKNHGLVCPNAMHGGCR